jgi:hypothetical protein
MTKQSIRLPTRASALRVNVLCLEIASCGGQTMRPGSLVDASVESSPTASEATDATSAADTGESSNEVPSTVDSGEVDSAVEGDGSNEVAVDAQCVLPCCVTTFDCHGYYDALSACCVRQRCVVCGAH